jgi:hypothetical protein
MSEELRKLTIAATLGNTTPSESAGEVKVVMWRDKSTHEATNVRPFKPEYYDALVLASDLEAVRAERDAALAQVAERNRVALTNMETMGCQQIALEEADAKLAASRQECERLREALGKVRTVVKAQPIGGGLGFVEAMTVIDYIDKTLATGGRHD